MINLIDIWVSNFEDGLFLAVAMIAFVDQFDEIFKRWECGNT